MLATNKYFVFIGIEISHGDVVIASDEAEN
jgi:hypothetical protein